MKTVLMPTDFNIQSLSSIPYLLQQYNTEKINIILVHIMKVTGSMQELLMLSKRSSDYQHISDEFNKACADLQSKYSNQITDIRIEFFYGSTIAVFKNFLEANSVDAIAMLNEYPYQMLNKSSLAPALLVGRLGVPVVNLPWQHPGLFASHNLQSLIEQ